MSWKSFACVAALSAITAPALAVPSLSWVDNGGSASLFVDTDAAGSVAAEILIDSTGLTLSNPVVNALAFDTPNPGNNPLTATTTNGLYDTEIATGDLFLSFGSVVLGVGATELFTVDYTGTGSFTASGILAQLGVNSVAGPEVLNIAGGFASDFNGDGVVDLLDLDILGTNFGLNPATMAQGDANGDMVVDLLDLDILGGEFGSGSASAIPEPTTMILGLGALAGLVARRRV